jgi:hypothetical protein
VSWFGRRRRKTRPIAPAVVEEASRVERPRPRQPVEAPAALRPPTPAQEARIRLALAEGIVTQEVLREELRRGGAEDDALGRALMGLPYPSMAELASALLRSLVPKIDPARIEPSDDALALVPPEIARRREALPLRVFGDILCVAMSRPEDVGSVEEIRRVAGRRLKVIRADGEVVRRILRERYPVVPGQAESRSYRLRALPVDETEFESAVRSGGDAAKAVAEWESVWIHGDVLTAEGTEE